jgi:hypothetical protein
VMVAIRSLASYSMKVTASPFDGRCAAGQGKAVL